MMYRPPTREMRRGTGLALLISGRAVGLTARARHLPLGFLMCSRKESVYESDPGTRGGHRFGHGLRRCFAMHRRGDRRVSVGSAGKYRKQRSQRGWVWCAPGVDDWPLLTTCRRLARSRWQSRIDRRFIPRCLVRPAVAWYRLGGADRRLGRRGGIVRDGPCAGASASPGLGASGSASASAGAGAEAGYSGGA
jgi:hypothetical protein